jgi:hypothetical protein
MNDLEGLTASELAQIRSSFSLAAQVLYQCRVMALLREAPQMAYELLRDPVLLAAAYKARWESDPAERAYPPAEEPDDY